MEYKNIVDIFQRPYTVDHIILWENRIYCLSPGIRNEFKSYYPNHYNYCIF